MTSQTIPLEDVAVTPLPPERFDEVLSGDALAGFARAPSSAGASCSTAARSGT
jgi:hypothetical protein